MMNVLIAEDDLMIADAAEEILVKGGYRVCGIARTVTDAVTLVRTHKPDLAVIDLRLAGDSIGSDIPASFGAQAKCEARCGVLYATGNTKQVALTDSDGDACLAKPYSAADLVRSLQLVSEIVATGKASPPFPRGFRVLPSANLFGEERVDG
jgi:DNA-binding response OmpR family regulator